MKKPALKEVGTLITRKFFYNLPSNRKDYLKWKRENFILWLDVNNKIEKALAKLEDF